MNRRAILRGLAGTAATKLSGALDGFSPSRRVEIGDATLDVFVDSQQFPLGNKALIDWVTISARAVSAYFGRFPVPGARIQINVSEDKKVSGGMSFGDGGAHCKISVGRRTTLADLHDDWELTHEMVHFSFPSVQKNHHWIEEGTATYVEPIARALVGSLTPERVWGAMLRDMHQGLPQADDRGLDHTHTWGRTYWGGALFCLLADVEIRKRTGNGKGLQDALRAINQAGGNIAVDWPIERAFQIGDKATDGGTLMELYGKMAKQPFPVDLPHLWEQLGVGRNGHAILLDDRAPLAAIRRSICGRAK